jgi:drug/metabolite transporter (DMT)-like permease
MEVRHPSRTAGILFILAAITTWGAYFPYAKVILRTISPESFLILRLGVGTLTLALLNLKLRKSLRIARRDWLFVSLAGIVGIVLHQFIQLNGLKTTSATNTGWILTLIPPVTGILGWYWLKERVAIHKIIGLIVAMAGVTLLVARGDLSQLAIGRHRGDLFALASVGTWSLYTVMIKSRLSRYEPLAVAAVHMALGFMVFGVVGADDLAREAQAMRPSDWLIAILIGIVPSGLAYYWWAAGLKRLSAIDTSMFLFTEAIVASLTGWLVLDEVFTPAMVLGTVIIIVGVWVAQSRLLDRKEWGLG